MSDKWYRDGVRFACTGCGACCTGAPGFVWMSTAEIDRIAGHLGLDREIFLKTYARTAYGRYSLIERPGGDCILLDRESRRCTIYDVRPIQCVTFPFWPEIMMQKAFWDRTSRDCPGMNCGKLHKAATIEETLHRNDEE